MSEERSEKRKPVYRAAVWTTMFAFLSFVLILIVELVLLPLLSAFVLYKTAAVLTREARGRLLASGSANNGDSRIPIAD